MTIDYSQDFNEAQNYWDMELIAIFVVSGCYSSLWFK